MNTKSLRYSVAMLSVLAAVGCSSAPEPGSGEPPQSSQDDGDDGNNGKFDSNYGSCTYRDTEALPSPLQTPEPVFPGFESGRPNPSVALVIDFGAGSNEDVLAVVKELNAKGVRATLLIGKNTASMLTDTVESSTAELIRTGNHIAIPRLGVHNQEDGKVRPMKSLALEALKEVTDIEQILEAKNILTHESVQFYYHSLWSCADGDNQNEGLDLAIGRASVGYKSIVKAGQLFEAIDRIQPAVNDSEVNHGRGAMFLMDGRDAANNLAGLGQDLDQMLADDATTVTHNETWHPESPLVVSKVPYAFVTVGEGYMKFAAAAAARSCNQWGEEAPLSPDSEGIAEFTIVTASTVQADANVPTFVTVQLSSDDALDPVWAQVEINGRVMELFGVDSGVEPAVFRRMQFYAGPSGSVSDVKLRFGGLSQSNPPFISVGVTAAGEASANACVSPDHWDF